MNKKNIVLFLVFSLLVAIPSVFAKQIRKRKHGRYGRIVSTQCKPIVRGAPAKRAQRKKRSPLPAMQPLVVVPKTAQKSVPKKRIVIFSSRGGGGHTAVSKGLTNYLKDDYHITVVNAFNEVLAPVDTLGTLTFGKINTEDFYNFCIRVRWTTIAGAIAGKGKYYIDWRQGTLEKLFLDYFNDEKPDLIISVMPAINAALMATAQRLSIPFLIITNDLDTTNYINNIVAPKYPYFKYTIPFEDPAIREKIKQAQFSKEQVTVTGFPLRPEFFKEKDTKAIKRDFDVPENVPVVMVFMGGAGSMSSYRYVRCLAKMQEPMHILVCLGRNEQLRRNINKILLPECVTMSIIGFTDRIADLMAISDVLITKPGPGSMCEALESQVPMILDQTGANLWWEEMNISFMVKHGFAESLMSFKLLPDILCKYLVDTTYTDAVKKKMKAFKRERFDLNIKPLIAQMIDMKTTPVPKMPLARSLRPKKVYSSVQKRRPVISSERKKRSAKNYKKYA